ncbi:hypothetical protein ACWDUC_01095 [Streptomyces tricolor]
MTIRVHQVDRYGTVTREYGTVSIPHRKGPPPLTSALPSCACPDRRAEEATAQ